MKYYISTHGNDAWSGQYPEPNPAGTDGPFATVSKARDIIRQLRADGKVQEPVTVWLRGGRYPLAEPLVFTPDDSGPVTYTASAGEVPVFDGGSRISGWAETMLNGVPTWVADVSDLLRERGLFRQLFVNGVRRPRPRLPKTSFFRAAAEPQDAPNGFVLDCAPGVVGAWSQPEAAELVFLAAWVADRKTVAGFEPAANRILGAGTRCRHIRKDTRFYIDNLKDALTQPGEWYLDRPAAKIYYLPFPGEMPGEIDAVAAFTPQLLKLQGEPDTGRHVEGLTFAGLEFAYGGWPELVESNQADVKVPAVIDFCGVRNCRLDRCRVRHCGWYGLELGDGCSGIEITNCEFTDLGAGGIKIGGADAKGSPARRTGHSLISGNRITECGQVFHGSVGILLRHASEVEISRNEVADLFYSGISCGWVWGYAENVTRDIRILDNHIHHIGYGLLADMGGIYTLGVQPGTVIRGNRIHDVWGDAISWGIYLDEGSSEMLVENNLCYNISHGGFHIHYGRDNLVRNNILAFTGDNLVSQTHGPNAPHGPYSQCGPQYTCGFTFERNILIGCGWPAFVKYMTNCTHLADRLFRSDGNLFWDVSGKPPRWAGDDWHYIDVTYGTTYDLPAWQKLGFDQHSVYADPKFKDVKALDFTLAPDSPALALGFVPFPLPA